MSSQADRQLRPVYDALDTGSNKTAILACNKILKKSPSNNLVKALKALALVRTQKVEESLVLCDEVLAAKTTDDATLSAMMHVLRGLGRHTDMMTMFDEAYKRQPNNEDLGVQTFFANVRTGNWKAAQQVSAKMSKQFHNDVFVYWSVISAVLQANDSTTPPAMRSVLFKLSHRLIASTTTPSYLSADRFYLHLSILRELQLWDEAYVLLDNDVARAICDTSLICDEIRREIWAKKGLWAEESQKAQLKISQKGDRNWIEFLAVVNGIFASLLPSSNAMSSPSETEIAACLPLITSAREFFTSIALRDGKKDRSGRLALLELERRARDYSLSTDSSTLESLLTSYFSEFGDKACCFEDLKRYISVEDDLTVWTSYLENLSLTTATENDLQRSINIEKLLRHNLSESQLTPVLELQRADRYLQLYLEGLKLGENLSETEIQFADDFVILFAQTLVNVWRLTGDESYLHRATVTLEFALTKSLQCYQFRLLLIQLYRILGAPTLALEHYRGLNLKQIQNDTLSHFLLSRISTFSLAAIGDLTYSNECTESSQIYVSNSTETAEFIIRAFNGEKYSQIPEFIDFEDRLDNSLQRDLSKLEHVRMRVVHEAISSDLTDMELIELKFIFDRCMSLPSSSSDQLDHFQVHHDNRDYGILPNYQPRCVLPIKDQTSLFGREPGSGWLQVFLKIYIRAFQQGSDLDDTVEEKLLVGDRPKQNSDPGRSLKERLVQRRKAQEEDLTSHELLFLDYATELADWLEPYHDRARPPPAVVIAEAMKQSESKTGKPLKGIEISAENGNTNGSSKKDEEVPRTPPPDLVSSFFDEMQTRFKAAIESNQLPPELLHIASLTQEALILLTVETGRFKSASVVKVHKLGVLVQRFKEIRAKAVAALRAMSADLSQIAEKVGNSEQRDAFVESCRPLSSIPQIGPKMVGMEAKKFGDDRKKILDGFSKGMLKVAASHA